MILSYDNHGILAANRVPEIQTVNKEHYRMFLMKYLRPAVWKKRPELLEATPLILHDNAACHKAEKVTLLLTSYGRDVSQHPAYLPDMSPPDFDLFTKLKELLRSTRFYDLEDRQEEVANQIRVINFCCLATAVGDLPRRWTKVIEQKEYYIAGM